jgi:hypothetical protein
MEPPVFTPLRPITHLSLEMDRITGNTVEGLEKSAEASVV